MTEETLFHEALSRPVGERGAYLDAACAGRPDLRHAVAALLAAHAASHHPLDATVDSAATLGFASGPGVERPSGAVIAGRYTLVEKLGEGGMGEVWAAQQTEPVKRKVALKLIKGGMDSSSVLARFEAERQALALMDHPNIARVLDGGVTSSGQPFFVMELVEGQPLTAFCDAAQLNLRQRLELFVAICQAVQHAHQKGVVHRDLKPANILVTVIDGKPVPKVIDFGVAKATGGGLTDTEVQTQAGAVLGTLDYMAPEQAGTTGEDIDTRADVYSLGVILYELLTGTRPLDSQRLKQANLVEIVRAIREEEPPRPSTRVAPAQARAMAGELDWIALRCLEKDRARRYESASDLARDVQRYLADEPVEARPPSFAYRLRKTLWRNRVAVAAVSAVAVALVLGLGLAIWQAVVATEARNAANLLAYDKEKLADDERAARHLATEATHEKDAQLQRTRAVLFTSQMDRVGAVLERDPLAAMTLLQDSEACPIALRDLAWGFARNAALRRELPPTRLPACTLCAFSNDGKWVACHGEPAGVKGLVTVLAFPGGAKRIELAALPDRGTALAFGHDGDHLAVATLPGRVHWFDLTTGNMLATLEGHTDAVRALACSPDGRFVATGSPDGTARIWNPATGALLHTLRDHGKEVTAVAFHPDGKRLATGGYDHAIRLWEVETGKPLAIWQAATDASPDVLPQREAEAKQFNRPVPTDEAVLRLDFSPDGSALASASTNWLIEVRDVATGAVRATVREARTPASWLAFHRDGGSLLSFGRNLNVEEKKVQRWDARTGQFLAELGISPRSYSPAYCKGQNLLASYPALQGMTWNLLDPDAPLERARLVGEKVRGHRTSVVFSPDGKLLVAAGGNRIFIWDVPTGKLCHTLTGHTRPVYCLALAPDGRTLASGSSLRIRGDEIPPDDDVRLWDITTGETRGTLALAGRVTSSLAFSPDGATLAVLHWQARATTRSNPTIGIFDARTREHQFDLQPTELGFLALATSLAQVGFNSRDGSLVCAAGRNLSIWDLPTRQERHKILLSSAGEYVGIEFASMAVHPEGRLIATTQLAIRGGHELRLWDATTGALLQSRRDAGDVGLAFSPDGRNLLTTRPRHVEIWDTATLQRRGSIPAHERLGDISLAVSPDGRTLASASIPAGSRLRTDNNEATLEVRLWDVGLPATKVVFSGSWMLDYRISPDSRTLVVHDSGLGHLQFWDIESGTLKKAVDVTQHRVDLEFSPDGRYLLGCDLPTLGGNRMPQIMVQSDDRFRDVNALVNLLDTRTFVLRQIEVGKGPIPARGVSATADGSRLAVVHNRSRGRIPALLKASTVEIWNLTENRSEATVEVDGVQLSGKPRIGSDDRVLAVAGSDDARNFCLVVVDVAQGKVVASFREPEQRKPRVVAFLPDGRLVISRDLEKRLARVWDWRVDRITEEPLPDVATPSEQTSPDGRYEIRRLPAGYEVIDRTVRHAEVVSQRRPGAGK